MREAGVRTRAGVGALLLLGVLTLAGPQPSARAAGRTPPPTVSPTAAMSATVMGAATATGTAAATTGSATATPGAGSASTTASAGATAITATTGAAGTMAAPAATAVASPTGADTPTDGPAASAAAAQASATSAATAAPSPAGATSAVTAATSAVTGATSPAAATPAVGTATPSGAAASGSATPGPTADAASDPFREREDRLAVLLGRARLGAGLLPLARSPALDRAAIGHAQDMVAHGYMEHEGLDGSTPGSRAAQEGYETPAGSAWMVIETISAMGDEPEGPLGWWLGDGLHRRVLLRPGWRELGVGYAPGGPYGRFWVAEFGCRPNVLPPVLLDGVLAVPDEGCGPGGADTFGSVQSARAAETTAAVQGADWQPYAAQQAWPAGHPAIVDLRDAAGHQLEAHAADPTGAPTQGP